MQLLKLLRLSTGWTWECQYQYVLLLGTNVGLPSEYVLLLGTNVGLPSEYVLLLGTNVVLPSGHYPTLVGWEGIDSTLRRPAKESNC